MKRISLLILKNSSQESRPNHCFVAVSAVELCLHGAFIETRNTLIQVLEKHNLRLNNAKSQVHLLGESERGIISLGLNPLVRWSCLKVSFKKSYRSIMCVFNKIYLLGRDFPEFYYETIAPNFRRKDP